MRPDISSQELDSSSFNVDRSGPIIGASSFETLLSALNANTTNEIQYLIDNGLVTREEFDAAIDQLINNSENSLNRQEIQQNIGQEAVRAWGDYVPIDSIVFPYAAKEEVWNDEWDEPPILELTDVLLDRGADSEFRQIEMNEYEQKINAAFESLSERDQRIIRIRFDASEEGAMSFANIASLYDMAEDATRSLLRRALHRLRRKVGDKWLKKYHSLLTASDSSSEAVMKHKYMLRKLVMSADAHVVETEIAAPELPFILEELSLKDLQEFEERSLYKLFEQLLLSAESRNFKVSPTSTQQTSYPREIYNEIEDRLGAGLKPQHIEKFWNTHSEQWLQSLEQSLEGEADFDKVGQLISALLRTRMNDTDSIYLRMPFTSRKVGYLGAWASRGEIMIEGDVGDFIGVNMTETARITVLGNVGLGAGARARGRAYLRIIGNAGDFFAHSAGDEATLIVEGIAGERAAFGIRQKPEIRINGRSTSVEEDTAALIDFDEVCNRLQLSPRDLEYCRSRCNYPSTTRSFTEAEVASIIACFPELAVPRQPKGFTLLEQAKQKLGFRGDLLQFEQELQRHGIAIHKFRNKSGRLALFIADKYLT